MPSYRTFPAPLLWTLSLLAVILAGCSAAAPLPTPTTTASPTLLPTSSPTATPTSTPTPIRTPPALPVLYRNDSLTPFGLPHPYIQDRCQVLQEKWSSANSAPGTVVMVIMFHSVTNNAVTSPSQISEYDFRRLMSRLHDDGFQAITTLQLADFMETNAAIPPRSVLLVVDDRKRPGYYDAFFRGYWEQWGWPVVNAWISADRDGPDRMYWEEQVKLNAEGWIDYQAHGVVHYPITENSSEEYILNELKGPITAFQKYFNKVPIAFFWPGGNFTSHAVAMARQFGYRLGFTINPRGPVMFNWVPLADWPDPQRPTWIPEGPVNDPLMVLPRYWDTDAIVHIIEVMQVGQEAAAYAAQNKATELEYYDIACAAQYGPIP